MESFSFELNSKRVEVSANPRMPLLWVLRDILKKTGTKYGCGLGQCGACTVHLNGTATRACLIPIQACVGAEIVTIEGLSEMEGHPVQQAWKDHNVPQCGYCQPGQIMTASALLSENPSPSDEEINNAMTGNLCRCGTYPRIKKAIQSLSKSN